MSELTLAFATNDDKILVPGHAGSADHYLIYRIDEDGTTLIERRVNPKVQENESLNHGDPIKATSIKNLLAGVDGIIGRRFGPNITRMVKHFICVITRVESIEESMQLIQRHREVLLEAKDARPDKPIILTREEP